MTSLRLKFRPSTANGKEGTLFFILTHRRATRTIYTEFHIKPNEWNDYSSAVKISGTPERQAQLQLIASKVNWSYKLLKSIIAEKETSCVEYSADDIIEAYRRLPPYQTWFCFIRDMVEMKISTGRMGTAKTYRDALSSFAKFRNGEDITADALEPRHIAQYEAWLKSRGLNRNSSSCYLRTLRTLYRKAVETGLTMDKDIFRHTHGFPRLRKSCVLLIVRHLLPRTTYVCILFLLCFFVCCAVAACGIYGADVLSRWSASGLHDYCCFSRCWMPCCAMWCIPNKVL